MSTPRPSPHSAKTSTGSYFDYQPSEHNVSPIKACRSNVHCLDAFHARPATPFEYPPNAGLYAKRALPPLPPPLSVVPDLHHSSSGDSLYSPMNSRPSTAMDRMSLDKSLPPLPLDRCPSLESVGSIATNGRPVRPRAGRSISFRGLLNRHTYPSNTSSSPTEDTPSLASSVNSGHSTRDSRADSVLGDMGLAQVKNNSTTRERRPSTLSLSQIRATNKKVNANPPALPTRPANLRKNSMGAYSSHRWNPFGRSSDEDKEDVPPMPATPSFIQELSFSQCYYFYARNCNGYVLSGGANSDACENCANAGYLGSP